MPSCAQLPAGEDPSLMILTFSNQVFAIILSPRFQNPQLRGISREPLPEYKKKFFPFFVGLPYSSPPRERRDYLLSDTTEADQYFLFHRNSAFLANALGLSPLTLQLGFSSGPQGRQRVAGGRGVGDPGLGAAQPLSAHSAWGRGRSQGQLGSCGVAFGVFHQLFFLLLISHAVHMGCFRRSTGSSVRA